MTFIEFFDEVAAENIAPCLSYLPERVVLLGDSKNLMKKHIAQYEKVFNGRKTPVEFIPRSIPKKELGRAVEILSELVETYDDCVFDINGGSEVLLLALGMVYARYPRRKIRIQKINLRNHIVYDCDADGETVFDKIPQLSVRENLQIYGGDILYGKVHEGDKTYRWSLTSEFLQDIERIWQICKAERGWNRQLSIFGAIEKVGSADGLETVADRAAVDGYLQQKRRRYEKNESVINKLLQQGLLRGFDDQGQKITVEYKDPQVKRALSTAGMALELKVFSTAKALLNSKGKPIYNDAQNGVLIDWDGEFHNEKTEYIYDTENEIDVLLMHGIVPIFISCKNGTVDADELYKLETVAERFGGPYAKKVLIAPHLNNERSDADEYLRQRAGDMGIRLIENFTDESLAEELKKLW